MPNTLAHIAVQGLATRAVDRSTEASWILAGAVVPDVPWILQRAVVGLGLAPESVGLRAYFTAQGSLAASLLLCGALAALARRPARVAAVLSAGAVLHLLLDATQTKWGTGVHLLAPVSWRPLGWDLYWPESAVTWILTAAGLVYLAAEAVRRLPATALRRPGRGRAAAILGLAAAYLLVPLAWASAVQSAPTLPLSTLASGADRPGRFVEFDREELVERDARLVLRTFAGEWSLGGAVSGPPGTVSVQGRFATGDSLVVSRLHRHPRGVRDAASLVGLALIAVWWGAALARTEGAGTGRAAGRDG